MPQLTKENNAVSLTDVALHLGKQTVFQRLTMDFSAQGISVLMGANGAGKTQLLRLIHGLVKPNQGKITVIPKEQQAFLPQTPILLSRTVEENLTFIRGCPVAPADYFDKHFEEVVDYFELKSLLSQQAMRLSGGQQKRLAIARLFLQQAQLYLIDEPAANVDYHTNLLIESAIEHLATTGKKVIITGHDVVQIERLFQTGRDELLLLYQGKLQSKYLDYCFEEIKAYL